MLYEVVSIWVVIAYIVFLFVDFYLTRYNVKPTPTWAKIVIIHAIVAMVVFILTSIARNN